jgi:PAS domain S-box-containing protein
MPHTLYDHATGLLAKVLIVENEAIIALRIQEMVEQLGHIVLGVASSGEEALEFGSGSFPDIVLMDIRLDGEMDGIETAAKIRALWGSPVVFMSAQADGQTLRRARTTEPLGFIVKPFTSTDVSVCIHFAMQRQVLQRQLRESQAWTDALLESVPDPTLAADSDGQVVAINKAAEDLTGWTAASATGQPLGQLLQLKNAGATDNQLTGYLIGVGGHRHKVSGSRKIVRDVARALGHMFVFRLCAEGIEEQDQAGEVDQA